MHSSSVRSNALDFCKETTMLAFCELFKLELKASLYPEKYVIMGNKTMIPVPEEKLEKAEMS